MQSSHKIYNQSNHDFFCVGVMYSGEYDVCDVTLECVSTPGKLEKYNSNITKIPNDKFDRK
jgi:hypothetical protein